jgi:signal transduction histidine kinase
LGSQRHTQADAAAPDATGGADEWLRYVPGWHAVMNVLAFATGILIAVDDGIDVMARIVALALTAALTIWYAFVGRRALRRLKGRSAAAYLTVAVPLTIGLFAAAPVGSLMLFALYPHIWAMLAPRRAVVVTIVVVGGVAAVAATTRPVDGSMAATALVVGAVSIVVALVLGLWIARIIRQSGQRAQLLADLEATRAELATLSRATGALTERERLAREIHDTLAQGFTSVLLLLEAVDSALESEPAVARRHLARARATARENLAEARALVEALTPPDLARTSLPEALKRIVERVDAEPGPRATLEVAGQPCGLPAEHEVTLLRSVQEALTNVRRHSGATAVEVSLAYSSDGVSLTVRDNGCGFDPAALSDEGYGLTGMRARASGIGGALDIVSAPGRGVTVRVDVPVA